ncbi:MAG: sigma-70 family RNA polymerase sigma factor [Acidobacteria bacterium]|nr:sigma-70 family RNA polymerase sigma factor [Acidobacteriota bacterium]
MAIEFTAAGIRLDLIRAVQAGERAAFEELVLGCRRRVMGTIGRMIARPEDVEDVAQEVFLRMHTSIARLQDSEAFDLWMYRLTINATYDYLRKRPRRRRELRMSELPDEFADWASRRSLREDLDRRRTIELVDGLMEQLSSPDRILLMMREVEGLSMQELAGVLGISRAAVKLRLFRARARLRRILTLDAPQPRSLPALTAAAAQEG